MHFPGREVHNLTKLCTQIRPVSGGPEKQREQATITILRENISLWEGVLVLKCKYIEQVTITAVRENISLWEGVLVLKCKYTEQATITALREYFSLGGCAGPERKLL